MAENVKKKGKSQHKKAISFQRIKDINKHTHFKIKTGLEFFFFIRFFESYRLQKIFFEVIRA